MERQTQGTRQIYLAHLDRLLAEANGTSEPVEQIKARAATLTRADVGNQDWQRFRQTLAMKASKDEQGGRGLDRRRRELARLLNEHLDRAGDGDAVGDIDLRDNPDPLADARAALTAGSPVR